MRTTDDDIDKFIAAVHGANSGRAFFQRISIPVGVIMHLKALRFELDGRNKCDVLPDAEIFAYIDIADLIVLRITHNQDSCDAEILKQTSLPKLKVTKSFYKKFESFLDNLE